MNVKIATLAELPGYIAILAADGHHASELFREWHKHRFAGSPKFHIDGIDAAWRRDQAELQPLADAGLQGIAYWTPEGWVVLPPDMEAPGPVYRSPEPVGAYKFSGFRTGGQLIVFASSLKDAWAIYRVWADLHYREDETAYRVETLTPGVGILRSARLTNAMALGVIGVATKRIDGWDVLPPWDEAAGDN